MKFQKSRRRKSPKRVETWVHWIPLSLPQTNRRGSHLWPWMTWTRSLSRQVDLQGRIEGRWTRVKTATLTRSRSIARGLHQQDSAPSMAKKSRTMLPTVPAKEGNQPLTLNNIGPTSETRNHKLCHSMTKPNWGTSVWYELSPRTPSRL